VFDVLSNVRVIEFGKFVAAPMATWLLAGMGAKVTRVESLQGSPDREPYRIAGNLDGAGFLQLNSNKRSLCLDHASPAGRKVVHRLLQHADVVVCGAPAPTLVHQGLDYETLAALNPRLIWLNVSAFTSQGPLGAAVGFDGIGQAMSGAIHMSGFGDTPTRSGCSWVDASTAVYSAFAIVTALLERERTGKGHKIETSLMTTAYAAMSWFLVEQAAAQRNRIRSGNRAQSSGPSDVFRTLDGWVIVQIIGDSMFGKIARLVGRPEWIDDPRFRTDNDRSDNGEELSRGVAAWCARLTTAEALQHFSRARIPAAKVNSLQEALDEPQASAIGLFQEIQHPSRSNLKLMRPPVMIDGRFPEIRTRPPLLGEHSHVVLAEAGFEASEIAKLIEDGVVV
jgi:crotonobetainyl-CoA:carnitine CoA-transferase CaiB-like acyl-CoA transferase